MAVFSDHLCVPVDQRQLRVHRVVVALASGDEAVVFLATQGDVWDTQWDMFLALCGAIASQLLFARLHDRQLEKCSHCEEP
ncbi:MAG: DUF2238 domain-containing protein [Sulfuricella sp.]